MFTMIKHIDYPRDSETRNITAAIHPQLQVQSETYLWLNESCCPLSDLNATEPNYLNLNKLGSGANKKTTIWK